MIHRRTAFTLVEVLASIALFLVVAGAIMGIFLAATNVYRDGEAARASNDEAIAALATIDNDLRRALPPSQGGFFYSQVISPSTANAAGNQVLAFTIANPDANDAGLDGARARLLVAYWIDNQTGELIRGTDAARPQGQQYAGLNDLWNPGSAPTRRTTTLARGGLYLGVELSTSTQARSDLVWSSFPIGSDIWCTEAHSGQTQIPMPSAIRVTLVMTGHLTSDQQLASRVFVVRDEPNGILVGGVRQLPIGPGAMVRIGDPQQAINPVEWMQIDSVAGNRLTMRDPVTGQPGRPTGGERNTQPSNGTPHPRDAPVVWGTTYTLVRRLLP